MWEWVFIVPGLAIVCGVGGEIVKTVMKSKERQMELRLRAQNQGQDEVLRQIQELRREMMQLRDTSTSFDLTIDSQLQRIERRLEFVEGSRPWPRPEMEASEPVQRTVRG